MHVFPQAIPDGLLEIVPNPDPDLETDKGKVLAGVIAKAAVTFVLALIIIVHGIVPEHPPPLQPEKVLPKAGVAVIVIEDPEANDLLQIEPQFIPDGTLETVPEPDFVTTRENVETGATGQTMNLPLLSVQTGTGLSQSAVELLF